MAYPSPMPILLLSKRSLLAATVAGAALLAAGCGSSSESSSTDVSPTTEWADGLCTALSAWTTSISAVGGTITAGGLSKDSLTSAVDDVKSATETFTSDIEGLGKPDTEAGEQAKESIDQLSTDLKSEVSTIEEALDGASGVAGVLAALPTISTALAKMGTEVTSTLSDLESLDAKGELESAFEGSSSCTDLAGS